MVKEIPAVIPARCVVEENFHRKNLTMVFKNVILGFRILRSIKGGG